MSKREPKRPEWETLRRLRYRDLTRLFGHRYGATLPDDDAGIEDLWLLLQNVSLAPFGAEKKMRHVCALLAPWLSEEGVQERIDFLTRLPAFERIETAEGLGERLRVTNAERELLKLWRLTPVDMTADELAEQRRKKERDRAARRRRQNGVKPRAVYLADMKAKEQPWQVEGISRATWFRRQKAVRLGPSATIVTKAPTHLVSPNRLQAPEGIQDKCNTERRRTATMTEKAERTASGSVDMRTDLVSLTEDELDERVLKKFCAGWRAREGNWAACG